MPYQLPIFEVFRVNLFNSYKNYCAELALNPSGLCIYNPDYQPTQLLQESFNFLSK